MLPTLNQSKPSLFRFFLFFLLSFSLFLTGCEIPLTFKTQFQKLGWIQETQEYSEEKIETLTKTYKQLSLEIEDLKQKLELKKDQADAKIEVIQARIKQAQEAYAETKKALEDLQSATDKFKTAVTP